MVIDEDKEPNIDEIRKQAAVEIAKYPEDTLFITQGYICRNAQGEIDNLQGEVLIIPLPCWEQHYRQKKFKSGQILMVFIIMTRDMCRIQNL